MSPVELDQVVGKTCRICILATGSESSHWFRTDNALSHHSFRGNNGNNGHNAFFAEIGIVRLVKIDSISSYFGAKIDSHVNAALRGLLEPVGEMAERLRVAIVGITHPPKALASRPFTASSARSRSSPQREPPSW